MTNETNQEREAKEKAFANIMGATDMPPDCLPEYDEWLFNKAWQAARSHRPKVSLSELICDELEANEDRELGFTTSALAKRIEQAILTKLKEDGVLFDVID